MKTTIVSKKLSLSMETVKNLGARIDLLGRGHNGCSTGLAASGCFSCTSTVWNDEPK